jgi:hypothetical protein
MTVVDWFLQWAEGALQQPWLVQDPTTGVWRSATDAEYAEMSGGRHRWLSYGIIDGMTLFDTVHLGAIVFAVVCARRLMAWRSTKRKTGSDGRIVAGRNLARLATAALLAAAFGMVLITVSAAVLVANYHREMRTDGDFRGLQTAFLALGVYVIVVPIANWLGMRLLAVRPAGLAAFGSWALLGATLLLVQQQIRGGVIQPAWFYGLVALAPYALAATAVACVPTQAEERIMASQDAATSN